MPGTKGADMKTKRTVAAAVMVAGILAFTGCTKPSAPVTIPDGPSNTATPSSSASASSTPSAAPTVGPPKDSAEAISEATKTTKKYWAVTDQIMNDGGKQPERIDKVSMGQAKDYVHTAAGQLLQEGGSTIQGSRGVSVTSSYSSDATQPDGAVVKNGFVGLTVCNDITGSKPINADGSSGDKGTVMRSAVLVEATYDVRSSNWLVSSLTSPGNVVEC
jgi:hypothetical protein